MTQEETINRITVYLIKFMSVVALAIIVMWWAERKENQGYETGFDQGRTLLIDSMLASAANDNEIVIKSGEHSVTFIKKPE